MLGHFLDTVEALGGWTGLAVLALVMSAFVVVLQGAMYYGRERIEANREKGRQLRGKRRWKARVD